MGRCAGPSTERQASRLAPTKEQPNMNLCHEFSEMQTGFGPIKLEQRGKDNFRVTYGLQVDDSLTYPQAAAKLGEAIMHYLALAGRLDNRAKGER
jgi:hypothetical protein